MYTPGDEHVSAPPQDVPLAVDMLLIQCTGSGHLTSHIRPHLLHGLHHALLGQTLECKHPAGVDTLVPALKTGSGESQQV